MRWRWLFVWLQKVCRTRRQGDSGKTRRMYKDSGANRPYTLFFLSFPLCLYMSLSLLYSWGLGSSRTAISMSLDFNVSCSSRWGQFLMKSLFSCTFTLSFSLFLSKPYLPIGLCLLCSSKFLTLHMFVCHFPLLSVTLPRPVSTPLSFWLLAIEWLQAIQRLRRLRQRVYHHQPHLPLQRHLHD